MSINPQENPLMGNYKGIMNTAPRHELSLDYLCEAQNIIFSSTGKGNRRDGYAKTYVGNVHSLYSNGDLLLFVENANLMSQDKSGNLTTLRSDITSSHRMWFLTIGGRTYYSNGEISGVIENGVSRSWGIKIPSAPTVSDYATGSLENGTYEFAITYERTDGQESGASTVQTYVTTTGGVTVGYSASTDSDVAYINLYASEKNGSVLYRLSQVNNATGSLTHNGSIVLGRQLVTRYLIPPPVSHIIEWHSGHILIAYENVIFFTNDVQTGYELIHPKNFFVFPDKITVMASVNDGVFVGTEKEIYLLSGMIPKDYTMKIMAGYGAIYGTQIRGNPAKDIVYFETRHGKCKGTTGGIFQNMNEAVCSYETGDKGAGLYYETDGNAYFLSSMWSNLKPPYNRHTDKLHLRLIFPEFYMPHADMNLIFPDFTIHMEG
jgi:hypothetical protein